MMNRNVVYFAVFFAMLVFVGMFQSWTVAFSIFNLCLISAIMALGVNIQNLTWVKLTKRGR